MAHLASGGEGEGGGTGVPPPGNLWLVAGGKASIKSRLGCSCYASCSICKGETEGGSRGRAGRPSCYCPSANCVSSVLNHSKSDLRRGSADHGGDWVRSASASPCCSAKEAISKHLIYACLCFACSGINCALTRLCLHIKVARHRNGCQNTQDDKYGDDFNEGETLLPLTLFMQSLHGLLLNRLLCRLFGYGSAAPPSTDAGCAGTPAKLPIFTQCLPATCVRSHMGMKMARAKKPTTAARATMSTGPMASAMPATAYSTSSS